MEVMSPTNTGNGSSVEKEERGKNRWGNFKCIVCLSPFENKESLEDHHRKTHTTTVAEKAIVCSWKSEDGVDCDKTFAVRSSLSRHLKTIHLKIPSLTYRCTWKNGDGEVCGKTYSRKSRLRFHFTVTHIEPKAPDRAAKFTEKNPSCFLLQNSFPVLSDDTVLKEKFVCLWKSAGGEQCGRNFESHNKLMAHHKAAHLGKEKSRKRKFICTWKVENGETCDKKFRRKDHLEKHNLAIHLKIKPFECTWKDESGETCIQKFSQKYHFKLHLLTVHGNEEEVRSSKYICLQRGDSNVACGRSFELKDNFRRHYQDIHHKKATGQDLNFVCTSMTDRGKTCGKIFKKNSLNKHHLRVHIKLRKKGKITCPWKNENGDKCNKILSNQDSARRHHLSVHLKIKPFECTWKGENGETCARKFQDRSHQQIHFQRVHETKKGQSVRKFVCREKTVNGEACGITFELKENLRRHCHDVHKNASESGKTAQFTRDAKNVHLKENRCLTEATQQVDGDQNLDLCNDEVVEIEVEQVHQEPESRTETTTSGFSSSEEIRPDSSNLDASSEASGTRLAIEQNSSFKKSPSDAKRSYVCDWKISEDVDCGKAFGSNFRLLYHKWLSHGRGKPRLKCPLDAGTCKREFYWMNELKRHLRIIHTGKIQCPRCETKLPSSESIINHDRIKHKGENLTLGFDEPESLMTGHLSQTNKNAFLEQVNFQTVCDWKGADGGVCGKVCESKSQLDRHKASSHSVLRFSCDSCNQRFHDQSKLNQHQFFHNRLRALGQEPFPEVPRDRSAGYPVPEPVTSLNGKSMDGAAVTSFTCLEETEAGIFCLRSFGTTASLQHHAKITHRKSELGPDLPSARMNSRPASSEGTGSAVSTAAPKVLTAKRWFPVVALLRDDVDAWKRCDECHVFVETSGNLLRHQIEAHSPEEVSTWKAGPEAVCNLKIVSKVEPQILQTSGIQSSTVKGVLPSHPGGKTIAAKDSSPASATNSLTFCGFCQIEFYTMTSLIHHLSSVHVKL